MCDIILQISCANAIKSVDLFVYLWLGNSCHCEKKTANANVVPKSTVLIVEACCAWNQSCVLKANNVALLHYQHSFIFFTCKIENISQNNVYIQIFQDCVETFFFLFCIFIEKEYYRQNNLNNCSQKFEHLLKLFFNCKFSF